MKFKVFQAVGLTLLLLGLGGASFLITVPLTMSVEQMKDKAASALDTSASVSSSQAEVLAFIRATHLATTISYATCSAGNGSSYLAMQVRAKALLSAPVYMECYFRKGKLAGYFIADYLTSALPSTGPASCASG